jgi:hypothetical protein
MERRKCDGGTILPFLALSAIGFAAMLVVHLVFNQFGLNERLTH